MLLLNINLLNLAKFLTLKFPVNSYDSRVITLINLSKAGAKLCEPFYIDPTNGCLFYDHATICSYNLFHFLIFTILYSPRGQLVKMFQDPIRLFFFFFPRLAHKVLIVCAVQTKDGRHCRDSNHRPPEHGAVIEPLCYNAPC